MRLRLLPADARLAAPPPQPHRACRAVRAAFRPAARCARSSRSAMRPPSASATRGAPPDRLHAEEREPRRGGAGRRRRAEPQPAGRRLSASSTATSARPPDACVITVPTGVRDKAAVAQSVQEIQRQVSRGRHRLPAAARCAARRALRRHPRDPARLPASRGGAAAVRRLDPRRRPQRGAHSLSELGLRHAAQLGPDGRQRARPRPAAGGRPPIERAAQRHLVGLCRARRTVTPSLRPERMHAARHRA